MKRLLIIGTGGTISCVDTDLGLSPLVGIEELIERAELHCIAEITQLFRLDSTNMLPKHWEELARHIREHYDEFDGFVITHGTDTMAYAAASLSCLIQNSRKPIVFTGSMKPMNIEDSDAPKNLHDAVRFALDDRAFGVRVVFCGHIFDGRRIVKVNTDSINSFDSPNHEDHDQILPGGKIVFGGDYVGETRFYERLSENVFHVKLIPGQGLYVPENVGAVILEGYGSGGVPGHLLGEVKALAERGVYIIIATQCLHGGTRLNEYEVGQKAAKLCPLLETGDMTVEYSVAKARWALAYSENYEEFKRLFYAE